MNGEQDATEGYAEDVPEPEAATGWTLEGTAYVGANITSGTAFFDESDAYTVIATYTYTDSDGAEHTATTAVVVPSGLGVEEYTVTVTLRDGYTWADGTDGAKTYRFYNYLSELHTLATAPTDPTTTYGNAEAVLEAIQGLFDKTAGSWTVTINGVEYTYAGSTLTDVGGNELELTETGTYTVVLALGLENINNVFKMTSVRLYIM